MSGPRRLAIFVSLVWVGFAMFISSLDAAFNLAFFLMAGAGPVAFIWGIWWVVTGFRAPKGG